MFRSQKHEKENEVKRVKTQQAKDRNLKSHNIRNIEDFIGEDDQELIDFWYTEKGEDS